MIVTYSKINFSYCFRVSFFTTQKTNYPFGKYKTYKLSYNQTFY
ncbi:unnamed protein product [Arabidopsis halleri]